MSFTDPISPTLYLPLLGRIYASKYYPQFFHDPKALALEAEIPQELLSIPGQYQYALLSSAVRSLWVNYYLGDFFRRNTDPLVINLGCGLDTSHYQNNGANSRWFEIDLPDVIALRKKLLPEEGAQEYLGCSIFDYSWIEKVQKAGPRPVIILAMGLFYYFHRKDVVDFIKHLGVFEGGELVFDATSSWGVKFARYYVRKSGNREAEMFFSLDNPLELAREASPGVTFLEERPYFDLIQKDPSWYMSTKFKMFCASWLNMGKCVRFGLGKGKANSF